MIEAAYRRLAKKYHPDVSRARDDGAHMREINAAYEILRDPRRRWAYNSELQMQACAEDDRDD